MVTRNADSLPLIVPVERNAYILSLNRDKEAQFMLLDMLNNCFDDWTHISLFRSSKVKEFSVLCDCLYYGLCRSGEHTGRTIGEESCGIIPFLRDKTTKSLRTILFSADIFPILVRYLLYRMSIMGQKWLSNRWLSGANIGIHGTLASVLSLFERACIFHPEFVDWFRRLLLSIFYLTGRGMNLIHELFGIDNQTIGTITSDFSVENRIIGVLLLMNIISGVATTVESLKDSPSLGGSFHCRKKGTKLCPICFCSCQFPAITPCGHIGCWNCMIQCGHKGMCPVCRKSVSVQSVIPLQNY